MLPAFIQKGGTIMARTLRKFRERSKPKLQYLVQEREGMDDCVYISTPALAKRKDMHPISEEEALEFLGEQWPELFGREDDVQDDPTSAPEEVIEETGPGVIAELSDAVHVETEDDFVKVPEPVKPKTDPKNAIGVDRDTDPECQLVMSFSKKNQVEHYLLFTHGLEIVTADKKLYDIKEEAISAIIAKRL